MRDGKGWATIGCGVMVKFFLVDCNYRLPPCFAQRIPPFQVECRRRLPPTNYNCLEQGSWVSRCLPKQQIGGSVADQVVEIFALMLGGYNTRWVEFATTPLAQVGPTLSTAQRAGRKSNRASEKARALEKF